MFPSFVSVLFQNRENVCFIVREFVKAKVRPEPVTNVLTTVFASAVGFTARKFLVDPVHVADKTITASAIAIHL